MLADVALKMFLANVLEHFGANLRHSVFAVAVEQRHDCHLSGHAATTNHAEPLSLAGVHVTALAADVAFVHFHVATVKLVERLRGNRHPQTVQHEPRGFLSDAKVARHFVAADTVLAVDEQPHRGQPLRQRNRAVLKQTADLDRELLAATLALPDAAGRHVGAFFAVAVRTGHTIRPAQASYEHGRHVHVREVGNCAQQGVWSAVLGSHEQSLPKAA